jgi:radical SAM superfamily enzyme YgiQ (UPF0313 family)
MTRILLINAIDPLLEVQYRFPPLGLGYLASALRRHYGEKAFDFRVVYRNVEKEIRDYVPDVVGITCVSQNYGIARKYAACAKSHNIPVIIGGIHISTLPQTMTADMDYAVIGEGEQTIVELMKIYMDTGNFPASQTSRVKGLAFHTTDGIKLTEPRPLIEPLDMIDRPARDILNFHSYANIFSSRGCPYKCTFCFSTRFWNKVRFFSAEYVLEEIKEMVNRHKVTRISFYDDLMIADKRRLERLVPMIRREPSLSKVEFGINARANLLTEDTVRLLKDMKCMTVGMGLESGNERTLKYLKGGSVSVEDNYNAVKMLHKYGITANASFIIGSPDETEEEILDTLRFIKTSGIDFVDTYFLTPLPGTPVWEEASRRGLVSDNMDWSRLNIFHARDPIIMSERLSREDLLKMQRKFEIARLMLAARTAWRHPFLKGMIIAGISNVANRLRRLSCAYQ